MFEEMVDQLRYVALNEDSRNQSSVTAAILWLAAEVRELRLNQQQPAVSPGRLSEPREGGGSA